LVACASTIASAARRASRSSSIGGVTAAAPSGYECARVGVRLGERRRRTAFPDVKIVAREGGLRAGVLMRPGRFRVVRTGDLRAARRPVRQQAAGQVEVVRAAMMST
jgi:hypothetical protein